VIAAICALVKEVAMATDVVLVASQAKLMRFCRDRMAMRKRHIRIGMAMQAVATHALREWQIKIEQGLPLNLSVSEIVNLMECGAQFGK
jgi:hypothetical protein